MRLKSNCVCLYALWLWFEGYLRVSTCGGSWGRFLRSVVKLNDSRADFCEESYEGLACVQKKSNVILGREYTATRLLLHLPLPCRRTVGLTDSSNTPCSSIHVYPAPPGSGLSKSLSLPQAGETFEAMCGRVTSREGESARAGSGEGCALSEERGWMWPGYTFVFLAESRGGEEGARVRGRGRRAGCMCG